MTKTTYNMKSSIFITALILLFSQTINAQDFERNRTIEKIYPIFQHSEIQISNKYGNVQVVNWEKDSVKFEIAIHVSGNKLSKVSGTFDNIDVDFSANQHYIVANTILKSEKNKIWSDISDLTSSILKGGNDTRIDYTVYLPEKTALKITNKFGNVFLTDRIAKTDLIISNGDLKANNFSGFLQLEFNNGNASIKTINASRMLINYADLRVNSIDNLSLESKSSTFNCEQIKTVKLNSKRDKLYLGELNAISGETSLSYVSIEKLYNNLFLETGFGDLIIEEVSNEFEFININSGNTDISATFKKNSPFKLDLIYTKKTQISLPTNYKNLKDDYVNEDKEESHLTAISGDNAKVKTYVTISQKSGSVKLINR